jgi:hypothetical protein
MSIHFPYEDQDQIRKANLMRASSPADAVDISAFSNTSKSARATHV